jgi:spermidine/putrescine transport system substrate-binding protein
MNTLSVMQQTDNARQWRFARLARLGAPGRRFLLSAACCLLFLAACTGPLAGGPAEDATPPPARQLTLYSWAEYMPQSVLDAFSAETGATVIYRTYESQDEAAAAIQSGAVSFDVAVIAYDQVPALIEAGVLARLDKANLPNFQNIGADFRNLFYDPANDYTVPYLWGTTALLVRTDLVHQPITSWSDLWKGPPGKLLARPIADELLGAALLALGYDLNSTDQDELEDALQQLLLLKPALQFAPVETEEALRPLLDGEAAVMIGWNGDALIAREQNPAIAYVLPAEGAIAWVDNLVISTHTGDQALAEDFINFVLRPDISAEITEAYYYPSANSAASAYVDPVLKTDPLLFPSEQDISHARFYLPRPSEVEERYATLWQRFEEAR